MKINSYVCPSCGDTVFSRATHDYRTCTCGEISVDGGFDYVRGSFKHEMPEFKLLDLDVTEQELYDDWNKRTDKYGIIKKLA